jgi:hypothetical protein
MTKYSPEPDATQPPLGDTDVAFRFDYGLDGTPMARGELQAVTYCSLDSKQHIAQSGRMTREEFNAYIWPILLDLERARFTQHGACVHAR